MKSFIRLFSYAFTAGCIGGLLNTFIFWATSYFKFNETYHIHIKPEFSLEWLYQRVLFAGIWGLLFLIPLMKNLFFWRGVIYSLIPSFVLAIFIIPLIKGLSGQPFDSFSYTYLFVVNALSGGLAGLWFRFGQK